MPRLQTALVAAVVLVGTISLAPAVPASAAERGRQHPESAQPPTRTSPISATAATTSSTTTSGCRTTREQATDRRHDDHRERDASDLPRFNLDLAGLHVSSIEVDGTPARFHHTGDELIVRPRRAIAPAAPFTVRVRYSG